jgi:hypothetical protein
VAAQVHRGVQRAPAPLSVIVLFVAALWLLVPGRGSTRRGSLNDSAESGVCQLAYQAINAFLGNPALAEGPRGRGDNLKRRKRMFC